MKNLYRNYVPSTGETTIFASTGLRAASRMAHEMANGEDYTLTEYTTDEGLQTQFICDVPKGEYFWLAKERDGKVYHQNVPYVKGNYDRSTKKYECYKAEDINSTRQFSGRTIVTTCVTY